MNICKECLVCDSSNIINKNHKNFSGIFWYCEDCFSRFVFPQPSFGDIEKIYNSSYFKNESSQTCGYDDYQKDKENIKKTAVKRLKGIEKSYLSKGKMLDVGCAFGFFLEAASERGWDVRGVDISKHAIDIASQKLGNKVKSGTLERGFYPKGYFDVVTCWDCIEHVSDPFEQIGLFSSVLKRGGLLVMSTPDVGSAVARVMGDKWMGYKDLEHLFYFSRKGLEILLRKNGFKVKKMSYIGKHVPLNLFIRRLSLYSKRASGLINFASNIIPLNLSNKSFYVNPFDIVCVYAEKI